MKDITGIRVFNMRTESHSLTLDLEIRSSVSVWEKDEATCVCKISKKTKIAFVQHHSPLCVCTFPLVATSFRMVNLTEVSQPSSSSQSTGTVVHGHALTVVDHSTSSPIIIEYQTSLRIQRNS